MGGTTEARKSKAGGAEAANTARAGCVFEFGEGQGSRRNRLRGKTRGGGRGDEPGGDAASRRRMEVALRCEEPASVSFSGAAKTAGRAVDARGSFAASGPVSCGQRCPSAGQRCGAGARQHHRATKRHVRLDEGRANAGDAQRRLRTNLEVYWRWDASDAAPQYPEQGVPRG